MDSLQEEDWAKERASGLQGIRLPLRFETNEEELNLIGYASERRGSTTDENPGRWRC